MEMLTLKRHNFFRNQNSRKATHSFPPGPLMFKLKQEVIKFNDIYVGWRSPKTRMKTNFQTHKIEVLRVSAFLGGDCK